MQEWRRYTDLEGTEKVLVWCVGLIATMIAVIACYYNYTEMQMFITNPDRYVELHTTQLRH